MRVRRPSGLSLLGLENAVWPAPVIGLLVAGTSLAVGPNTGDLPIVAALASMATFLFGILMAFTIGRARDRLGLVQDLVAKGNSSLFSIYQLTSVFAEEDCRRIRDLVDNHLTEQIDYRLVDYHRASSSFLALTDAVVSLTPNTGQQESAYRELIAITIDSSSFRSLIEAATGQALSPLEWWGLLLLLVLLLGLIAALPGGTILGALAAGIMSGALVTLVILIRKLDLLLWHERTSIWEPTTRLFWAMGQLPYVPRQVIDAGRYRPTGRVRVVDYPDPYPIRATKVVTLEDHGS